MTEEAIKEKIFSGNLFWQGGNTKRPRLDEINAARDRMDRGDEIILGDTSAWDIVYTFFKEAGFLQNRLAPRLHEVFAEALLEEMGGNPTSYMNELHRHPARQAHFANMGVDLEEKDRELTTDGTGLSAESVEPGSVPANYNDWNVPELKEELRQRSLPQTGNKDELVARLQRDDEAGQE